MRTLVFLFFWLAAVPVAAASYAPHGPIRHTIQNPIYLQFLGLDPMGAEVPSPGELRFQVNSIYSNAYEVGNGAQLTHLLDMEILRQEVVGEIGIGKDWAAGVEIPLLHFEGGFLDQAIQGFHNAFGFPNGGREKRANGQFAYRVQFNGHTIYEADQENYALGDISAYLTHHLFDEEKYWPAAALRFAFKAPTGAKSQGAGSGSVDYGFQLALEKSYKRLRAYLNAGYFVVYGNSNVDAFMNDKMFAWLTALELHVTRTLAVTAQLTGSTPLLKNMGKSQWDGAPLDAVFGFSGHHPKLIGDEDFFWRLGFAEDVNPNGPSIDFSSVATLGIRFGAK